VDWSYHFIYLFVSPESSFMLCILMWQSLLLRYEWIGVAFFLHCSDPLFHILYTGSNLLVPRVPLDEAVRRYKFILVIDGNCAAWRLQELLGEKRVEQISRRNKHVSDSEAHRAYSFLNRILNT